MMARLFRLLHRLIYEGFPAPPMIVDRGEDTPSLILANMVCAELLSFTGDIERRTEQDPSLASKREQLNKSLEYYLSNASSYSRYPRYHWKIVTPKCTVTGYGLSGEEIASVDWHLICPGVTFNTREQGLIAAAVLKAFEFAKKRASITAEQKRQESATQAMEKWLGIGKFGAPSLEDMSLKAN